ncbi:MAG: hypothetical protein IKH19_02570 [Muribaculaceae bacterium]|nr:hypothetical protein [Muribaculaceae bacterium]
MRKTLFVLIVSVILSGMMVGADAKKKQKRHRRVPPTEQVWTALGGFYYFVNDEHSVSIDFGIGEEPIVENAYVDSETCSGTYDVKTHLIELTNESGEKIFEGKIYDGGNLLKGTLHGKPVALRTACGA